MTSGDAWKALDLGFPWKASMQDGAFWAIAIKGVKRWPYKWQAINGYSLDVQDGPKKSSYR